MYVSHKCPHTGGADRGTEEERRDTGKRNEMNPTEERYQRKQERRKRERRNEEEEEETMKETRREGGEKKLGAWFR
jgi:hypothetical protein